MKSEKRRRYLVLSLVFFLLLGSLICFNACAPAPEKDETESQVDVKEDVEEKESATEGPVHGGTINFGERGEPRSIMTGTARGPDPIGSVIYQGLVRRGADLAPEPLLAESWSISEDGLTVQFNLRKGVRFHDGVPLTSADVKFTFEEIVAKHQSRGGIEMMKQVESIDTPDDHTVIFNFNKPYGPFFATLYNLSAGIAPKHVYEGVDVLTDPIATHNAVGTGPFKLGEWKRDEYIILERNDDYWREPMPYLDRIVYRFIPDTTTAINALEAGDIDIIPNTRLPRNMVSRLEQNPDIKINIGMGAPAETIIQANLNNKYLSVKEVRQAILHAIDREFICEAVYQGWATPAKSIISPLFKHFYNPSVDYSTMYLYDPQKAEQLLDAAGFPRGSDGIRFTLGLIYQTAVAEHAPIAEIIRENLNAVGIKLEIEGYEDVSLVERVYKNYDFDLQMQHGSQGDDPTIGIDRWYRGERYGRGEAFVNASGYANDQVDSLLEKAATTVVLEERAKYFKEVQEIVAKDIPVLNIVEITVVDAARKHVQDLWIGSNYQEYWDYVWIKE